FFKREGRAGEKGTLTARMIDRPIRPLFPKGWRRETQLVAIPMSIDHVHPYDILAMNGASAAIQISDIPVEQPVGAVRVGQDDEGNFVVNPPEETLLDPKLDLVVAGTQEAILMVEAGAKEVSEQEILDALDIAHGEIKKLCEAQHELRKKAGKEKAEVEVPQVDEGLLAQVKERFGDALNTATQVEDKLERQDATKRVEEEVLEAFGGEDEPEKRAAAQLAFDKLEKDVIRQRIAVDKKRPGGPKRRDIRHGALAERALVPVVPSVEEFPYTIRVVSDILESNGSSSMASVCGSSLSLMNAGVPIERPVAGIAMGLIKEGDDYIVLSDIAGVEDHLGDMDFKVAGTENGITALQMDIKISGVTFDILRDALDQAHKARTT